MKRTGVWATLDPMTAVLVLGARYGALGVARSLGRLGVPMYAAHDERAAPALSSRFWRRTFAGDFSGPADRSIEFLRRVRRAIGRPTLLLCTSDPLTLFVAELADALAEAFVFPLPAGRPGQRSGQ